MIDSPATLALRAAIAECEAPIRIFAILTDWMNAHPKNSLDTRVLSTGRFELVLIGRPRLGHRQALAVFHGSSIQDAYAQAAQAIALNDGGPL